MSDSPTHFRNEVMRLLARGLKCKHHFTQAYCPWSNEAVERLGKEVLRACRSLISELQLRVDSWPDLKHIIQSVLNNSTSPQRNNIAPLTAFTGLSPSTPITTFLRSDTATIVSVNDAQIERFVNVQNLLDRMEHLRPLVHNDVSDNRKRAREHNSKGQLPNFSEGDYVLVARNIFFEGEKLCLHWRGPRRIIKALSDYLFDVEDLRSGKIDSIHGSRLKYYSDSSLDEKVITSHVLSSETRMPVARLMKLVKDKDKLKVQVRWKGLSPQDDTLEPLQNVFEDVPQMLDGLLKRKNTSPKLAQQAQDALDL